MADTDIPVAYGTPVPPTAPMAPPVRDLHAARTANGGSSRVGLRADASQGISNDCYRELKAQGYTQGLAQALAKNKQALPLSIWVVDNSGSMSHQDGNRLVSTGKKHEVRMVSCTRWKELQETVEYHAQMAALLKSPTVFRLLNDPGKLAGPQQFSIAECGDNQIDHDLAVASSTINNTVPGGVTPLVGHLREMHANIKALEPELRRNGTKVVIVLATDGIPTDEHGYSNDAVKRDFSAALRSLEGLPVWIVVRLCTDEEHVVDYWNDLDTNLELSLEVLDDFTAEAQEVHEHNPWLTYGLPLQRMREMGFHHRIFDLLDERKLSKDELSDFFRILFGVGKMDGVPEPEVNWAEFVASISRLSSEESKQWNPLTKHMEPWVDMRRLKKEYGHGMLSFLW